MTIVLLCPHCPQPKNDDLYDAISLGLHQNNPGLGDLSATVSPTGVPDKDGSPRPPPKPQVSFLHMERSLDVGPWNLSEEESVEVRRMGLGHQGQGSQTGKVGATPTLRS